MVRVALAIPLAAFMLACARNPGAPADTSLTPVPPSAAVAMTHASTLGVREPNGRQDVLVTMQDACDPLTFGADSCVRAGGVTFDQFVAELSRLGFIGPWRFAPSISNVEVGQTVVAVNQGGETHTFTEVAEFGGGIVPFLNHLSRVPIVAQECAALDDEDFVAAGATYRERVDRTGNLKFQCCIHPWMRLEATSTEGR